MGLDGIYSGLRADDQRLCALVVIGANERGQNASLRSRMTFASLRRVESAYPRDCFGINLEIKQSLDDLVRLADGRRGGS